MTVTSHSSAGDGLVGFYLRGLRGPGGATFDEVLRLSDQALERRHDYIQWIFPTYVRSEAVPESPTLSAQDVVELRADPLTRQRVTAALLRMLAFYGLELDDDPEEPSVDFSRELFARRKVVWLTPDNHNYRRITRILTSLQILGCAHYATALFDCLTVCHRQYGGLIGPKALGHWKLAVQSRKP